MQRQPFGPVKLPSGKEIHFVEPLGSDRAQIMARAIAEGRQGEMLFMMNGYWLPAKCMVDANGKFVAEDFISAFNDWSDKDVQFYRAVFDELFGWNNEIATTAKAEAARFLLKAPGSPSS
jgi:hypothetical protein